jgi:hypothetical protein
MRQFSLNDTKTVTLRDSEELVHILDMVATSKPDASARKRMRKLGLT